MFIEEDGQRYHLKKRDFFSSSNLIRPIKDTLKRLAITFTFISLIFPYNKHLLQAIHSFKNYGLDAM